MNNNGDIPNGNGNGNGEKQIATELTKTEIKQKLSKFEQKVILKQTPIWSRAAAWTIVGVTGVSLLWASVARIEQVVNAKGQLEPVGTVKEVRPPVNGVVKEVLVKDGDKVTEGQLLITFDSSASKAELSSLEQIKRSLTQENQFYRTVLDKSLSTTELEKAIAKLEVPPEVASLARNLTELTTENKILNFYLYPNVTEVELSEQESARLNAIRAEYNSRREAAELEKQQLVKQLSQNQLKLADAQAKLATDRQVATEIKERNETAIARGEESLSIDEGIVKDLEPLVTEGAIARLQVEQQKQRLNDRSRELIQQRSNGIIEYNNQQQQVQTQLAEIDQLLEENQRLELNIEKAQAELDNVSSLREKDVRQQVATNSQRIADIESQLTKLVVENDKRLAETTSQISRAQQTLTYQELRAPVAGTVFDLQASPGFVPQPSQAEALLKIVPDDELIAKVYITNKDIGFVQENMNTDVRIDSFPYSEFGDIKGKLIWVGSDALPPDQFNQYYRFPAKIKLDAQYLVINSRQIDLQSGMSVSVNIKIRENRTVLSLLTELFSEKTESLKQVR